MSTNGWCLVAHWVDLASLVASTALYFTSLGPYRCFFFPKVDVRILWGTFWGLTGIMAHFVHRWYTFDNHKSLRWTLPTAIPVYLASMYGSSVTIGWLEGEFPEQIVWLGIPNLLFWGVIIWLTMRIFVFQFSSSRPHASQEDRME